MSDLEKSFWTFVIAASTSVILAGIINWFTFGTMEAFYVLCLIIGVYVLVGGAYKNGEYEKSIGGILNQVTDWVMPTGLSWWVPRPIGKNLRKISIEKRILDRSVKAGKAFQDVKTRDGGQVEVGVVRTWRVIDVVKASIFKSEAELENQVLSLLDRSIRYFSLYFDSDEAQDPKLDSALSHRKVDFSRYLMGAKDIKKLDSAVIDNDTIEKLTAIGVTVDNDDVVDVNEPKEVQDARNKAAAEKGQAIQEKLDIASVRQRVDELMWNTSSPVAIKKKIADGVKPRMSSQEALRTVRAARKDLEDINVSGGAGDFTKGAALQRNTKGGK